MVTLVWSSNDEIIEISESLEDPVTTQGSPAPMIYHQRAATTQLKRSQAETVIPTKIYPVTVIDTNNNNNNDFNNIKHKYLAPHAHIETDVNGGVEGVALYDVDVTE